jgi:hydroxyacylglutathione hydrolase
LGQSAKITAIGHICTHHHRDHTGGISSLAQELSVPVYGSANEEIPEMTHPLTEGDTLNFPELSLVFDVLAIPGHTAGHIAYHGQNYLFCGDTLFSGGCGRIFEGNAQQMFASLQKLASLPDETLVYCAHEYTLANIQFARTLDPDNADLIQLKNTAKEKLVQNMPTLPTSLALEKAVNPFLRCDQPAII